MKYGFNGTPLPRCGAYIEYDELLPKTGNLYKINLHTHSTLSDGRFTPAELKEIYMAQGYSAVAFTDHRKCIPHQELTDSNFVALTGYEIDYSTLSACGKPIQTIHLNAIARNPMAKKESVEKDLNIEKINNDIASLKRADFYIIVNHPVWSGMSTAQMTKLKGCNAVEVYNSISVEFSNYSDDSALLEYMFRAGKYATPIASDDCHMQRNGKPSPEYFRGFNMVKAPSLDYGNIIDALDFGATYASTGPLFENVWIENDILHVECSPSSGVFLHGKYINQVCSYVESADCITHAEFDISGILEISPYIWLQLRDTKGGKAWFPPYNFKF